MSRPERVDSLLRQIEHETKVAFDEHTDLLRENSSLKAENAKLRKRVAELLEFAKHFTECMRRLNDISESGGCVLCPYQSIDYDCDFESRARELVVGADA